MNGIVSGKVVEGTIRFNSAIHKDMVANNKSLEIETMDASLDYFKLVMTDNRILIGQILNFSDALFSAGSFVGANSIQFTFLEFN